MWTRWRSNPAKAPGATLLLRACNPKGARFKPREIKGKLALVFYWPTAREGQAAAHPGTGQPAARCVGRMAPASWDAIGDPLP